MNGSVKRPAQAEAQRPHTGRSVRLTLSEDDICEILDCLDSQWEGIRDDIRDSETEEERQENIQYRDNLERIADYLNRRLNP